MTPELSSRIPDILRNPEDRKLSPWYDAEVGLRLITPEWIFKPGDLKGF